MSNELSNFDIINIIKELQLDSCFGGVYSKDQLPNELIPPEDVEEVIKEYIYNDEDIQDLESTTCGYFCIAFIKFLRDKQDKQEAYKTFVKIFKLDTSQNDRILQKLIQLNYYNEIIFNNEIIENNSMHL
jgi:hypothetical protein